MGCFIVILLTDIARCIWVLAKVDVSPFWHTFTVILLIIEIIIVLFFCLPFIGGIFGNDGNNKQ